MSHFQQAGWGIFSPTFFSVTGRARPHAIRFHECDNLPARNDLDDRWRLEELGGGMVARLRPATVRFPTSADCRKEFVSMPSRLEGGKD
jgi:hypothetical protein